MLDEFQAFLAGRKVLPSVAGWSEVRSWTVNRLKTEIFNQALSVAQGDEIEAQRDVVILTALQAMNLG